MTGAPGGPFGLLFGGDEMESGQDLAEEKPASQARVNEQGISSPYPHACAGAVMPLRERRGVGEAAEPVLGKRFLHRSADAFQPLAENLVVITSPGVAGHEAPGTIRGLLFAVALRSAGVLPFATPVRAVLEMPEPHENDASGPGEHRCRAVLRFPVAMHVAHASRPAA